MEKYMVGKESKKTITFLCLCLLPMLTLNLVSCAAPVIVAEKAAHYMDPEKFSGKNIVYSYLTGENSLKHNTSIIDLGDDVILRMPASMFFVENSANTNQSKAEHVSELAKMISAYDFTSLSVELRTPVEKFNVIDYGIASNQVSKLVQMLTNFVDTRLIISSIKQIKKSDNFADQFNDIGNIVDIKLTIK